MADPADHRHVEGRAAEALRLVMWAIETDRDTHPADGNCHTPRTEWLEVSVQSVRHERRVFVEDDAAAEEDF